MFPRLPSIVVTPLCTYHGVSGTIFAIGGQQTPSDNRPATGFVALPRGTKLTNAVDPMGFTTRKASLLRFGDVA